ncbi:MAG: glycosyltransferase family 39 protein [Clostridiales bacterium]
MNKINSFGIKYKVCYFIVILLCFIISFNGISTESLWYDESFSAAITDNTYEQIIQICADDYHPPLYFLLLKFTSTILGNSEFGLRFLSLIGLLLMALLGFGPVRRIFGVKTGLIYLIIISILPINISMAQETRMYTLAAFFVTGCMLYGYLLLLPEKQKIDIIFFSLFTVAASLSHYYALLAVAIINIIILFIAIKCKNKINIKLISVSIIISILLYSPWIKYFIEQLTRVQDGYWISFPVIYTIFTTIILPFSTKFEFYSLTVQGIMLILLIYIFIKSNILNKKNKDKKYYLFLISISVYLSVFLLGIILSILVKPIFINRYLYPSIGLFSIGVSYCIASLKIKKELIIIMSINMMNFLCFFYNNN